MNNYEKNNTGIQFNVKVNTGSKEKLVGVLMVFPVQTQLGGSIAFLGVDYETNKFDMFPMNMCKYTTEEYVEPEHSCCDGELDCNSYESPLIL